MKPEEIFTPDEMAAAREALAAHRPPGAYEEGRWSVHPLNRAEREAFPPRVMLRDITLRTIEQMPGIVNTAEERLAFLAELAHAGVPEIVTSSFRRGHTLEEMRREAEMVRAINPAALLVYGNAVKPEEMDLAAAAGYGAVQVWSAVWLGKAMPVSAGAVYHRVWQGRDWRDLRFPPTPDAHFDRARRLVREGVARGLKVGCTINLVTYATEAYVADFCAAVAEAGAYEVTLADSAGGTGPEAMARLARAARAAAPGLIITVHAHNLFGLAAGISLAALRAGADAVDVSVNGYEVGPAGCQASLAGMAVTLEALYGVPTGIDLSRMARISEMAARLTGVPVPWNEPVLGSGALESSGADEYEQEQLFDPLIHGALMPELVGAQRVHRIGATTGPLGMGAKLEALGIAAPRDAIAPILTACIVASREARRALEDAEIRAIAAHHLAQGEAA
jgi:isopropylmalate/homocitrate/citramalate synthase